MYSVAFISFSLLLPRATCRALMACRSIITALMRALSRSSYGLISSVLPDTKCLWRSHLHIVNCFVFFLLRDESLIWAFTFPSFVIEYPRKWGTLCNHYDRRHTCGSQNLPPGSVFCQMLMFSVVSPLLFDQSTQDEDQNDCNVT